MQVQVHLRENLQILPRQEVKHQEENWARTHDTPSVKRLICRKNFPDMVVSKISPAYPLYWLYLLTLHRLMNCLIGKVNFTMPFPFPHLQWEENMQLTPSIKVQNKETPRPPTTKSMLFRDKYLTWMIRKKKPKRVKLYCKKRYLQNYNESRQWLPEVRLG